MSEFYIAKIDDLTRQNRFLEEQVDILKDALRIYADKRNWCGVGTYGPVFLKSKNEPENPNLIYGPWDDAVEALKEL